MAVNFLNLLPPEIVNTIVEHVGLEEYLPLKMTCKAMAAHMPMSLQATMRKYPPPELQAPSIPEWKRLAYFARLLDRLEHHLRKDAPRARRKILLCTECARYKPLERFLDNDRKPVSCVKDGWGRQLRGEISARSCMDCETDYRDGEAFRYGGKKLFYCPDCQTKKPYADRIHYCPNCLHWRCRDCEAVHD